jgi:hypothetical protein
MSSKDFFVDPSMSSLLRFTYAAFRCLSSSTISLNHPKANWDKQVEHVFRDTLSNIAAAVIVSEAAGTQRVTRFDEFNEFILNRDKLATIHPIPRLMEGFTLSSKPILWMRLVALGGLCSKFVNLRGRNLGSHQNYSMVRSYSVLRLTSFSHRIMIATVRCSARSQQQSEQKPRNENERPSQESGSKFPHAKTA